MDYEAFWKPMKECPPHTTVLLLNPGKMPVRGSWDGKDTDWLGWYPYPKYDSTFKGKKIMISRKWYEKKARIVTDRYLGYEVQLWRWWFPFWIQAGYCNTHRTLERAEEYAIGCLNIVVKEL